MEGLVMEGLVMEGLVMEGLVVVDGQNPYIARRMGRRVRVRSPRTVVNLSRTTGTQFRGCSQIISAKNGEGGSIFIKF